MITPAPNSGVYTAADAEQAAAVALKEREEQLQKEERQQQQPVGRTSRAPATSVSGTVHRRSESATDRAFISTDKNKSPASHVRHISEPFGGARTPPTTPPGATRKLSAGRGGLSSSGTRTPPGERLDTLAALSALSPSYESVTGSFTGTAAAAAADLAAEADPASVSVSMSIGKMSQGSHLGGLVGLSMDGHDTFDKISIISVDNFGDLSKASVTSDVLFPSASSFGAKNSLFEHFEDSDEEDDFVGSSSIGSTGGLLGLPTGTGSRSSDGSSSSTRSRTSNVSGTYDQQKWSAVKENHGLIIGKTRREALKMWTFRLLWLVAGEG